MSRYGKSRSRIWREYTIDQLARATTYSIETLLDIQGGHKPENGLFRRKVAQQLGRSESWLFEPVEVTA